MKRVAALLLAVVVSLAMAACTCAAAKKAADEIEASHRIVLPQYVSYVEKDASLNPDQKNDRKKLVESLENLVKSLKQSLQD